MNQSTTSERKLQPNRIPIWVNGVPVWRVEDNVLRRNMKPEHFIHTPEPAIAFDSGGLSFARSVGARVVVCDVRATGDCYTASVSDFDTYGYDIPDKGHGAQRALGLSFWTLTTVNRTKGPADLAAQLRMFRNVKS